MVLEGYSTDDMYAMKAKINFAGSKIGDHPNVLSFIGAVVNEDASKCFYIRTLNITLIILWAFSFYFWALDVYNKQILLNVYAFNTILEHLQLFHILTFFLMCKVM